MELLLVILSSFVFDVIYRVEILMDLLDLVWLSFPCLFLVQLLVVLLRLLQLIEVVHSLEVKVFDSDLSDGL